jgi:hypothetical protein
MLLALAGYQLLNPLRRHIAGVGPGVGRSAFAMRGFLLKMFML